MPEWSLVGGNPAPGDPASIRDLAGAIGQTATDAQEARVTLDDVSCEASTCGWEGDGAVAFADAFAPLPSGLGLMARSYERVSGALFRYADQLEAIQVEVDQALVRAELAAERRRNASTQVEVARARLGALRRQLEVVGQDEAYYLDIQATRRATGGVDCGEDAAVARAQATRYTIETTLCQVDSDEASARRARDSAITSLANARDDIAALRCDREAAETVTARTIVEALADCLRNEDGFSAFVQGVRDAVDGVRDFVGSFDAFLDFVAEFDQLLGLLEDLAGVLAVTFAVIGVLAVIVAGLAVIFSGGALAPLLLPAVQVAIYSFRTARDMFQAKEAISKARVVTGTILLVGDHPRADGRAVDGSDLAVDAAFAFGAPAARRWLAGGSQAERHVGAAFRRSDDADAIDAWRGVDPPTVGRVEAWAGQAGVDVDGYAWRGGHATFDLTEDAITGAASDGIKERLNPPSQRAKSFAAGGGAPVVRACYAAP